MQEEGVGEELADPVVNLAAAIQMLSALTANIGCIAGPDVAFEAVKTLLAMRPAIEKMIVEMRKATSLPNFYPPQEPLR